MMDASKFRAILVVIFLAAVLSVSSVMARLRSYYTISSSGLINLGSPIVLDNQIAYESEIRAVFFHMSSLRTTNDWDAIMNVLATYNVSTIVIEGMLPTALVYPSPAAASYGVPSAGLDFITPAVSAAHPLGIDVYIAMDVLGPGTPSSHSDWASIDHNGNIATTEGYSWMNPTNPEVRAYLRAIVEELVTNYPQIEGFMYDYIRWMWQSAGGTPPTIDYSTHSKNSLEQWLNETITTWPGDFAPEGIRFNTFLEWRVSVITQLVSDMNAWMKAKKPDLKIAAAPWSLILTETDSEIRKFLGQDWQDWAMKGLLDWVAPMSYNSAGELETLFRPNVRANIKSMGGPEGIIPLSIFIANQYPDIKTPQQLADQVRVLREEGLDGWIIWKYGGPGATEVGVDITSYLAAIDASPLFSIRNITVYPGQNNATITWVTDIPTTSRAEYSENPLFTASLAYDPLWNFNYTSITHKTGNIVEDLTKVTFHSMTIGGLAEGRLYYFRVQSQDSRTATSKVYRFSLSSVSE